MLKKNHFKQKVQNLGIKLVDLRAPLHGRLSTDGGCSSYILNNEQLQIIEKISTTIREILKNDEVKNLLQAGIGKGFFFQDIFEIFPEIHKFLTLEISNDIKNYIGSSCFLDRVALFLLPINESYIQGSNRSDLWHHDSVGHRLKYFVPLNLGMNTESSPHEYLIGSNVTHWKNFVNNVNASGNRLNDAELTGFRIRSINMQEGSSLLIDTNGIHKGRYESSGIRASIQFEFSAHKSWVRGYVGPVNYKIPNEGVEALKKLGLINLSIIKKVGNTLYMQHGRKLSETENFSLNKFFKKITV